MSKLIKITDEHYVIVDDNGTRTHSTIEIKGVILLSIQEVKELISDVKIKGQKYSTTHEDVSDKLGKYLVSACFQDGYYTALEDNKHKKYTEEDVTKAWEAGMRFIGEDKGSYGEFIKSLQLKTEWEVEIVDGKLKLA